MHSCIELKVNSTLRTQTEDDKLVILILKLSQFNPLEMTWFPWSTSFIYLLTKPNFLSPVTLKNKLKSQNSTFEVINGVVRQKNWALCWNNSAKFLWLFVLYENFPKTMGFPHKTPAQEPHFLTRSGYKLAKTWLPAVPVLQHCQLPPRTVSIYTCNQVNTNLSSVVFYLFLC